MTFVVVLVVYVALAVVTYSGFLAHHAADAPSLCGEREWRIARGYGVFFALLQPIGVVMVGLFTGFYADGFRFSRPTSNRSTS